MPDALPPALLRAPHRLAFLLGMLSTLLLFAAWFAELASRLGHHTIIPVVPAVMAHALLMLYGIFPLFMTGFIFTAGPRWLGTRPPSRTRYLLTPGLMATGVVGWLLGLALGKTWLLAGLLLYGLGFASLTFTFAGLIWRSQQSDRRHALMVLAAFGAGLAGVIAAGVWLFSGETSYWLAMRDLALWGFLLPVFLTVCHRMLPFFTGSAMPEVKQWRPYLLLIAMVAGSWLHGILVMTQHTSLLADLPLAVLFGYTSWRWGLLPSRKVRLLWMLHLSFAWLAVAFFLYTLAGLMPSLSLGLAPLHAVTVGFFMTMVIAFVSRVTLGHSGLPLQAGTWLWRIYLAVHVVALTRVLADFLPQSWVSHMYAAVAFGALLALLGWSWRLAGLYLKPRADGKPG
ncbi:MAG TPA: NnrS family protein [Chromobacteriaceae bacterium]|nr:NnrS family protein [Chromobacteriaceae bacterium]